MLIKKNLKIRIKNLLSKAFVFSAILGMTTFGVQSAEAVSSSEYISNTANWCLSADVADLTDTGKGIFQSSKVDLKGVMTGGASYATLNEAVSDDDAEREYALPAGGETLLEPLGAMGGTNSTLTIDGSADTLHGINGSGNGGVAVSSGQTLILDNIANISGFTTPFLSNGTDGTVTINNSVFTNNTSSTEYVDIYNSGTLNLNAAIGKTVTFNGAVTGENGILVINNDPTVKGGTYVFNGDIDGQIMRIYNGAVIKLGSYQQEDGSTTYGVLKLAGFEPTGETVTLDLRNNHIDTHHFGNVIQSASVNHLIDVDLTGNKTDRFTADKTTAVSGDILIGAINLMSGSGDSEMIVNLSRNSFRFAMALTPDIMSHISWAEGVTYNVNTLDYDYISGNLIFNAADFIPNGGTLDKVYKTSSNYLAKGIGQHAVYSSSDLSTVKDDDHPYVVVIGGTLYYFKPHESTDELNNAIIDLAATGALADKVVLSTDNYIFEKDGKYYTYSKALLPKSVWEDSEANSSSYNYYESVGTTNNYYNVVFRTNFMNAIDTTTWELSDSATAGGYSWWGKNYTPFASEIKPVKDGSGNLISASGMVRLDIQKNDTQAETRYYRYNYTVPADYEKASSRIVLSDDYITNKYFYGLSNSSNGGAVYNNTNHGHNINADFINNSTTGNGGAIYNDTTNGKLGYISGTFINNRGYEGGVLFNNRGTIKAILGDFIGNIAGKSGGLVRNYYGTIGLIQGRFIGNRAGETEGGWGGVISNKVDKNDTHIEKAYIEIILGDFIANRASKGGGAIDMNGKLGTVIGDFIANKSIDDGGGAIRIDGGFIGNITGDFISNTSNKGGAMHLQGNDSKIGVIYGDFITNSATSGTGGAINLGSSSSVLEGVYGNFTGNTSTDKGGAVYNAGRIDRLSANFAANHSNNTSGGAIYNASGAYIGLRADDFGDILFRNNTAGTGTGITYNDIYNAGTIDFIADTYVEDEVTKQHTITLDGTVTGSNGTININKDSVAKGGKYIFNNTVSGNTINLYNGADVKLGSVEQSDTTTTVGRFSSVSLTNDANGGVIDSQNSSINTNSMSLVTLGSNLNLKIDADLSDADKTKRADNFTASSIADGETKFVVNSILVNADSTTLYTKALLTSSNVLKPRIGLSSVILDTTKGTGVTNEYKAKYDNTTGYLIFKNASATNIVDQARNEYGFYEDIRTYNMTANDVVATDIANYGNSSYAASSIGAMSGTSLTVDGGTSTHYGINGSDLTGITVGADKTLTVQHVGSATYVKDSDDKNVYTFDADGKVNNVTVNNSINNFSGSAIIVNADGNAVIDDTVFYNNNQSTESNYDRSGLGIKNFGTITHVNADFIDNNGIASYGAGTLRGGALNNSGTIGTVAGNFINNKYSTVSYGTGVGAAIFNTGSITSISGDFAANRTKNYGGAIYNGADGSIGSISGRFIKNHAGDGYAKGGAIANYGSISTIDAYFESNSANIDNSLGGAIYNGAESDGVNISIDSINGDFIGNSAKHGGALYNSATTGATVTIDAISGNFINNYMTNNGGAIYNNANTANAIQIGLFANGNDMTFYNNRKIDSSTEEVLLYNDIYNKNSTIELNALTGNTIRFGGTVTGNTGIIDINKDSTVKGGTYLFANNINNNTMNLYNGATVKLGAVEQGRDWLSLTEEQRNNVFDASAIKAGIDAGTIDAANVTYGAFSLTGFANDANGGTLDTQNYSISTNSLGSVTLNSDLNYIFEMNLDSATPESDKITANYSSGTGKIVLSEINLLGTKSWADFTSADVGKSVKILNSNNNALQLALSSGLATIFEDNKVLFSSSQKSKTPAAIGADTQWVNDAYKYTIVDEKIYGKWDLKTTSTTNDSLGFIQQAPIDEVRYESMGDALKLVNNDTTNSTKNFTAQTDGMTYTVGDNLGATKGTLNVNGIAGGDAETIDLKDFTGFEVGTDATALNFNNVTVESSTALNPTLITVSNGSASIGVSNAVLNGAITRTGDVTYNINATDTNVLQNVTGAKIANSGDLTLSGTNNLVNITNASGSTEITGGTTTSGAITQDSLTITGGKLVATNGVTTTNGVTNSIAHGLEVQNGTINSDITGTGSTDISTGNVSLTDGKTISQQINLLSGTFTTNADGIGTGLDVTSGTVELTGGTLAKNITGAGTTKIKTGDVIVTDGSIANNVSIESGSLTSSIEKLGGTIANEGTLNATGTLAKAITGAGTTNVNGTLTLNSGATIDGTLNLNSGAVTVSSDSITSHDIGTLTGTGSFAIDINSGAGTIDNFTIGSGSTGTVNITSLNDIGTKPTAAGTYTYNVITGSGVTLTLADSIKTSTEWYQAESTSHGEHTADTIQTTTDWNHIYYDKWTDTTTGKSIAVSGNAIVYNVINHTTPQSQVLGDTLALVNQANIDRTFSTADATKTYTLSSALGTTAAGTLTLSGASDGTNTSTIDLNTQNGFNLTNATTLTLTDVVLTNATGDAVTLNNSDAALNISANSKVDGSVTNTSGTVTNSGSITGAVNNAGTFTNDGSIGGALTNSGTFTNTGSITGNVVNSGTLTSAVDNLGGTISNTGTLNATGTLAKAITGAGTTKVNGTLTLNSGADIEGTLNLNNGAVTVSNGSITSHSIGTLSGAGSFAIDINSGAGTIDNFTLANTSSGTLNITSLNDIGTKPTAEGTYIYNVITGSGVTLTLADSIKTSSDWYQATSTSHGPHTADTIQTTTDWDHIYYDRWTDTTTGKSIAVSGNAIVYNVINHTSDESAVLGDTLALVNQANIGDRTFSTTDKTKTYTLSSALGTTAAGTLTLSGASDGTNTSTIDLNNQNGFNLTNATTLTLTDVKLTNATGDAVTLNNSDAALNISTKSTVDGSVTNTAGSVDNDGSITGAVDNAGTFTNDGSIGGALTNSGIFTNTGTISGNVTNSGSLTSVADDILGTIANNGTLTLNGGNVKNDITGTGTTNITADLNNPQTIGQDTISVNSGVTVTNSGTINAATALTLNGDLDNKVGSSLTAGTITNNGTLQNLGSVTVGGGVNSGNITGIGSLTNTGNLTNNASIVQSTVANSGNLVNNGTIFANTITNNAGSTITSNTQNLISSSPIVNSGTLNLTGSATFSDISGDATGKVNINADSSSFILNNNIQGNELTFNGDVLRFGINGDLANTSQFNFNGNTVDLVNNNISNTNFGNLNLLSNMNLMLDGNFAQQTLDTISATGFNSNGNFINISHINILEPTTAPSFSISPIGEDVSGSVRSALASAIRYTGGELVYSPIYKYSAEYDPANGILNFTNLNGGDKFNPAVLVAPAVTQAAGQVTMWQSFNTAFEHADTFMPYPRALRTAQQNANLYALSTDYNDNIDVIAEMGYEHTNLASWVKPYTSFESLSLKNGPKMDMISYGSIFGGDSDFRTLKNGWSNVGTVYIGYNGSQIDYNDVDVTTNGGTLGITESFYKNNFFTAITVAAGGGFAQAHTMYGNEDLTMIMAGIASKTGYNFEFLDGRFIIQPTLQLNYSMVKTFDYTNAAGVRINSDPAHTLQINPNIRFIGNFKGGWQPYASIGMIWNAMNVSHNLANNAELPQMYTKPYVEYGVGLQKQIGENFSGYGQVMVRNGGRTGVALTAGFRWYIGRNKDNNNNKTFEKNVSNKTVIKKSKSTNKKVKSTKATSVSPEKN